MLPIDRFPLITESGYRLLKRLEEHAHAPRFTHPGYNGITLPGLARARDFGETLAAAGPGWLAGEGPSWLAGFVDACRRDVPFYRRRSPAAFVDLPATTRADLSREPWAFVPDGQSLDDLVVYNTSGVTGHPLSILTQPDTLALYIPLIERALALHGLAMRFDPERIGIAYLAFQKQTYTYASVSPLLNDAGLVKVNLNPADWRDPADRVRYLDDGKPQIYTGTPVALLELAELDLRARPDALISTSMTLTDGLRDRLAGQFGCPVIDLYSMNETGPVAAAEPGRPGLYRLLQPHLYVELLDSAGQICPPGTRGEITLTGGFNPLLPLVRYRTGDFAALTFEDSRPFLGRLVGRPPVVFQAVDGSPVNNVDISIALRPYAIAQYQLHQSADGALRLRHRGAALADDRLREVIQGLFGQRQALIIEDLPTDAKVIQYTRDLPGTMRPPST
jgi:phenylacetate-CoA ligase